MEKDEAYGILGVPQDTTPTEIRKAWRNLNKQYHLSS
jgi:DnaJ-class molecular chaperone